MKFKFAAGLTLPSPLVARTCEGTEHLDYRKKSELWSCRYAIFRFSRKLPKTLKAFWTFFSQILNHLLLLRTTINIRAHVAVFWAWILKYLQIWMRTLEFSKLYKFTVSASNLIVFENPDPNAATWARILMVVRDGSKFQWKSAHSLPQKWNFAFFSKRCWFTSQLHSEKRTFRNHSVEIRIICLP